MARLPSAQVPTLVCSVGRERPGPHGSGHGRPVGRGWGQSGVPERGSEGTGSKMESSRVTSWEFLKRRWGQIA